MLLRQLTKLQHHDGAEKRRTTTEGQRPTPSVVLWDGNLIFSSSGSPSASMSALLSPPASSFASASTSSSDSSSSSIYSIPALYLHLQYQPHGNQKTTHMIAPWVASLLQRLIPCYSHLFVGSGAYPSTSRHPGSACPSSYAQTEEAPYHTLDLGTPYPAKLHGSTGTRAWRKHADWSLLCCFPVSAPPWHSCSNRTWRKHAD
jgi:hypothetical protein